MSTTFKHARILAVPLAGFALVAAGLAAAPAQAVDDQPMTTVHIQNAENEPVSGLVVDAQTGDFTPEDFVETSTPGDYEATALYPGDWTLSAFDDSVTQPYVDGTADFTVNEDGDGQVLTTITLDLGAVVKGKVTAPSGHTLKNFEVTPILDGSTYWSGGGVTDSNGNFSLTGLPAGTYKFGYVRSYYTGDFTTTSAPAQMLTVGEISTTKVNLKKTKALAGLSVDGKSSAKKKATLKVGVDDTYFGIKSAGGTITIKEGKKTLKSKVKVKAKGALSTISLSKLKKGVHTFTVSYSGGKDVNKESIKFAVTVK